MNFPHRLLAFVTLLAALSLVFPGRSVYAQVEFVPDELVVGVQPSRDNAITSAIISQIAGAVLDRNTDLHVHHVKLRRGLSIEAAMAALRKRSEVLFVEKNEIYHALSTPNDVSYATRQYGPQITKTNQAWDIWNPQGTAILAIVDSGIDYNHPDLVNKILRDNNGNVIGTNTTGSNAHSGDPKDTSDDYGHGTYCAGIAAAQTNNATGIAGIAGWNGQAGSTDTTHVTIMPVKVITSQGTATGTMVANGVTWAADHGAKIISMSLGGEGSTVLSNAVAYAWNKGCTLIVAAGNYGTSALVYPAAYPHVISVGSTDKTDTLSTFSTYGNWVLVAAPGTNIYSTVPTYGSHFGSNYSTGSGTSASCPHVSGEAALLLSQNPALTNQQLSNLIINNVDPYNPYNGRTLAPGAGRINVYQALLAAGGSPPPIPPAPAGLNAAAGDSSVSLTWTASAGATSYNVKRSTTSGGPYAQVANVTTTSYNNTGLTNGVSYYYVVTALNTSGESGNSNQASATPQASVPQPPAGLTATAGDSSISLGWTASTGATNYNVKRSTTNGGPYTQVANVTTTSYNNTGLSNGVTYYYVVTALNTSGESGNSNQASATPQAATTNAVDVAPSAITMMRGTITGGSVASLAVSDDAPMTLTPDSIASQFYLTGTSPLVTPAKIDLTVEAQVSRDTISERLEMYSWTSATWVLVDVRNATAGIDGTVTISITANAAQFVNATGQVRTRFAYVPQGGSGAWTVSLDYVHWKLYP